MFELLIDTSNTQLNVGLCKDKQLIDYISYEAWQRQSELLVVEIDKLLTKHNVNRKDIDGVCVGVGPGSYTGVRIGLTVAKTICYACKCSMYAVSSLQLLKSNNPSIVIMNARSERSYFAVYDGNNIIEQDQILDNNAVKNYIEEHPQYEICGDVKHLQLESSKYSIIDNLLLAMDDIHKVDDIYKVNPVYLKDLYK